ncbi:hypothetical protein JCM8208_001598 [Rhodotorula glutinis]
MEAHKTNLNVRDALTYLDRVKMTFADQAEVYDRFLTIMKDFKSQGIDTPGVIDRVSTLFRGHPALIQGFNTFLPPGYRIECTVASTSSSGDASGTTITVTTPMGMTTRTQLTGDQADKHAAAAASSSAPSPASAAPPPAAAVPAPPGAPADVKPKQDQLHLQSLPPAAASATQQPAVATTPGAASVLSSQMAPSATAAAAAPSAAPPAAAASPDSQAQAAQARPPMEFNHAINYVNKIKNRFAREPETYKAFLEILQTYQKEGRAIQDVYAQVTTLFHTAPDLLDEFKQFLPDTSGDAAAAAAAAPVPAVARGPAAGKRTAPSLAPGGAKEPAKRVKTAAGAAAGKLDPSGVTGRGKGKRKADASPLIGGPGGGRKGAGSVEPGHSVYHSESPDPQAFGHAHAHAHGHNAHAQAQAQAQAQAAAAYYYGGVPPSAAAAGPYGAVSAAPPASAAPVYAYEPPMPAPPPQPLLAPKPVASAPDVAFFQRVKAHCKDQPTYHEFLKLVNLYSQDLIDLTALVARAWMFLHQDDALWLEFRDMVGWVQPDPVTKDGVLGDPGKRVELDALGRRVIENVPRLDGPRWRKAHGDAGKGWETYGPSYRRLPSSEISLNCSGRDALCWEVLNDEWVSQPSWASDEGFVAQRKNPYEEALHRSEEERHEYDYYIEANLRTIALLEPIATRIALMERSERETFRLKAGLGNQSKSIYQRVLKKVYGKEQGLEVIQALHENPCVAVPIVLARLKQKDEEWKRALREWNRTWRESDAKNFLKALDHQAIAIKANDKRYLNTKALVSEIESLKREQNQREYGSPHHPKPPNHQLAFPVDDRAAFFDAAKLILSYMDRAYTVSFADKPKVDAFLHEFLALAFAIPPTEFANECNVLVDDDDTASNADAASDAGTTANGVGGAAAALLDEAIEAALNGGSGASGSGSGSSAPTPGGSKKAKKGGDLRKKALRKAGDAAPGPPGPGRGRKRTAAGPVAVPASVGMSATGSASAPSSRAASPGTADGDSVMADGADAPSREASPAGALGEGAPATSTSTAAAVEPTAAQVEEDQLPEVIVPVEAKPVKVDRRRTWNVFCNSTLYCMLRLFQVLQSRLSQLRNSAAVLALPPPMEPITPSHVPTLSMSLSYAPPGSAASGWTDSPDYYYHRALAICEKMFDGDIDQSAFEDGIRRIMATQGYVLFTVDKTLTSILKLSLTAISDSKTKELFNLLRDDRAHPDRATASQQIAYRTKAEATLAGDENLYRVEWAPSSSAADSPDGLSPLQGRLAFQLMGKDVVGPEDLPAAERAWATYVANYVKLDRTPGLAIEPKIPYLPRNLRQLGIPPPSRDTAAAVRPALPKGVLVSSALRTKICLRSYKLFFCAESEDVVFRRRRASQQPQREASADERKEKAQRVQRWMDKRAEELVKRTAAPVVAVEGAEDKKVEASPAPAAAASKPDETPSKSDEKKVAEGEKEEPAAPAPDPAVEEKKAEEDGDVEMKA